ncbi:decarboxylase [Tribonema minus]|uniref:Decarboxylase n=1 Tax=Tribonema minus TaxID=303371 RepID=A0A835Z373_9STRA|nr:decarboxylase [Tribonema minus]
MPCFVAGLPTRSNRCQRLLCTAPRMNCEDQNSTPIVDALAEAAAKIRAPLFFPGHKMGRGAPAPLVDKLLGGSIAALRHDLPELPELDNLFCPSGPIRDAESLAAAAFGASRTWFLANGSTAGVQALLMACVQRHAAAAAAPQAPQQQQRRRSVVILPRNAHKCAISALVLTGAAPAFLAPAYDAAMDLCHAVRTDDLRAALSAHSDAVAAVLVVSPTYTGAATDVRALAVACRARGVPLLVDEAHGGHLQFMSDDGDGDGGGGGGGGGGGDAPCGALRCGADAVVQSSHKTLASLTQSALLHVRRGGLLDGGSSGSGGGGGPSAEAAISAALEMFQSSSPNYLLLASLDAARWALASERRPGVARLRAAARAAESARARIEALPGLTVLRSRHAGGAPMDPLKVTVYFGGASGYDADDLLIGGHGVYAEMPATKTVTFAFGPGSEDADADALVAAVAAVAEQLMAEGEGGGEGEGEGEGGEGEGESAEAVAASVPAAPRQLLSPREAHFARAETVAADAAVGRASAETVCAYPPGIPVLLPGEAVTAECLAFLRRVRRAGGDVTGCADATLETLRVVA